MNDFHVPDFLSCHAKLEKNMNFEKGYISNLQEFKINF